MADVAIHSSIHLSVTVVIGMGLNRLFRISSDLHIWSQTGVKDEWSANADPEVGQMFWIVAEGFFPEWVTAWVEKLCCLCKNTDFDLSHYPFLLSACLVTLWLGRMLILHKIIDFLIHSGKVCPTKVKLYLIPGQFSRYKMWKIISIFSKIQLIVRGDTICLSLKNEV